MTADTLTLNDLGGPSMIEAPTAKVAVSVPDRLVSCALCLVGVLALVGCDTSDPYTLYRDSRLDPSMRIHWATFDARGEPHDYNSGNCRLAADMLNEESRREDAGAVRYWCEAGRYRE